MIDEMNLAKREELASSRGIASLAVNTNELRNYVVSQGYYSHNHIQKYIEYLIQRPVEILSIQEHRELWVEYFRVVYYDCFLLVTPQEYFIENLEVQKSPQDATLKIIKQVAKGVCPECGNKVKGWKPMYGRFAPEWWESMRERGINPATGHAQTCSNKYKL